MAQELDGIHVNALSRCHEPSCAIMRYGRKVEPVESSCDSSSAAMTANDGWDCGGTATIYVNAVME